MHLFVAGINHRTVSLGHRERHVLATDEVRALLRQIPWCSPVVEVVLLSTCNRLEVYGVSRALTSTSSELFGHILRMAWPDMPRADFSVLQQAAYLMEGEPCVRHLFRVTSGLDSQVVGETEITGQVKRAYHVSLACGATGTHLNRLFQKALSVSKKVRTGSGVGAGSVSVGSVAMAIAEAEGGGALPSRRVMVMGTGEVGKTVLSRLAERTTKGVWVASRSAERARDIASRFKAEAVDFRQVPPLLTQVDILVTATAVRDPLFTERMLSEAMRARQGRPLLIVDLGVPRNVAPAAGQIEGVRLVNLDEVGCVAARNLRQRHQGAESGEKLVTEQALRFSAQKLPLLEPTACRYRAHSTADSALQGQPGRHYGNRIE